MSENGQLHKIVEEELTETFGSFTGLDRISDPTVLTIVLLLSAQVAFSVLLFDPPFLTGSRIAIVFIGVGVATTLFTLLRLGVTPSSLLPVEVYGQSAGESIPGRKCSFVPYLTPDQFSSLGSSSSRSARRQGDDETDEGHITLCQFAKDIVEDYGSAEEIRDYETCESARLRRYEKVGERKAEYTGVGLAWLRIFVGFFLLQFAVLLTTVIVS